MGPLPLPALHRTAAPPPLPWSILREEGTCPGQLLGKATTTWALMRARFGLLGVALRSDREKTSGGGIVSDLPGEFAPPMPRAPQRRSMTRGRPPDPAAGGAVAAGARTNASPLDELCVLSALAITRRLTAAGSGTADAGPHQSFRDGARVYRRAPAVQPVTWNGSARRNQNGPSPNRVTHGVGLECQHRLWSVIPREPWSPR